MKWNIFFTITGPSQRIVEAPNSTNPINADTLKEVLKELGESLPTPANIEYMAIRIERTDLDHDSVEI